MADPAKETVSAAGPTGGQHAFYARDAIVPFPVIEHAAGVFMTGTDGSRYMDVSSGPVVSNIGHGNARVADAMAAQVKTVEYVFPRLAASRVSAAYATRLSGLAGPGFERAHLASGGSEAMENAIKFLRQYAVATGAPSKRRIITCEPSYHGATIATLAMNGEVTMAGFLDGFATPSLKVPAPMTYRVPDGVDARSYADRCVQALERTIVDQGPETVLAFVIEPVGGLSTGCVVPPDDYMRGIRQVCSHYGVHLVFDEILCGMGRTGKFLAARHWPDAKPDIVTMAKGMASGYSPLGAMLAPADMVDELAALTGFEFQYSYNAHPVSCAAGMAVLDEYQRHDLIARAETGGAQLRAGLEDLQTEHAVIGDIRGLGMLLAVELVADRATKAMLPNDLRPTDRIRIHGLDNGLLIYSRPTSGGKYGHWFIVAPPLTITPDEIDELLRRLDGTLAAFGAEMRALGAL